jgi:hypothetical protein
MYCHEITPSRRCSCQECYPHDVAIQPQIILELFGKKRQAVGIEERRGPEEMKKPPGEPAAGECGAMGKA